MIPNHLSLSGGVVSKTPPKKTRPSLDSHQLPIGVCSRLTSCPERKTFSCGLSRHCERTPVPRPAYTARVSIRSIACRLSGFDWVVTVKAGASSSAEVRQALPAAWPVLRTMVASSVRSVGKLWMGVPSAWCRRATFAFAPAERSAGATGSWVALAAWSSSAKSNSRQTSFRCHST